MGGRGGGGASPLSGVLLRLLRAGFGGALLEDLGGRGGTAGSGSSLGGGGKDSCSKKNSSNYHSMRDQKLERLLM